MLAKHGLVECGSRVVSAGETYGLLKVLAIGKLPGKVKPRAVCECSCGTPARLYLVEHLRSGNTKSCGCLNRKLAADRKRTHGVSCGVHYSRWKGIMGRCYNPKFPNYKYYGARGIGVYDGWHDPAAFSAGLPDGYFHGAELDRIDNEKGYEPGNCRWVTRSRNQNNRRDNPLVEFDGMALTYTQWSDLTGINPITIRTRIRRGWDVGRALGKR